MIDPKELRIGNFVGFYKPLLTDLQVGTISTIQKIAKDWKDKKEDFIYAFEVPEYSENVLLNYQGINPIPLTEEWMLRSGCKDESTTNRFKDKITHPVFPFPLLQSLDGEFRFHPESFSDNIRLAFIINSGFKYVHQWQNIFYYFTGKELQINSVT